MGNVQPTDRGYAGQQVHADDKSQGAMMRFMVEQMLGRVNTAMLVQVKKVTNQGEVKAVGQVDVLPLAKLMDGAGKTFSHGVINDLAYFRLQGGKKAVIMDPKVGDIGVAVFADRDISGVKSAKKEAPPGSFRRFDMADGLFFPCFLGEKPTCYIDFTDDNKIVMSPDDGSTVVTVEADKVHIKAGSLESQFTSSRIDLGQVPAPLKVLLEGLVPSTVVFAKP